MDAWRGIATWRASLKRGALAHSALSTAWRAVALCTVRSVARGIGAHHGAHADAHNALSAA